VSAGTGGRPSPRTIERHASIVQDLRYLSWFRLIRSLGYATPVRVLPAANHMARTLTGPTDTGWLWGSPPACPARLPAAEPRMRDTAAPIPPAWVWPVSSLRLRPCAES
jgi:hypothetical protein